jgi:hypothetical protein
MRLLRSWRHRRVMRRAMWLRREIAASTPFARAFRVVRWSSRLNARILVRPECCRKIEIPHYERLRLISN